jgi:hypothetical protein
LGPDQHREQHSRVVAAVPAPVVIDVSLLCTLPRLRRTLGGRPLEVTDQLLKMLRVEPDRIRRAVVNALRRG